MWMESLPNHFEGYPNANDPQQGCKVILIYSHKVILIYSCKVIIIYLCKVILIYSCKVILIYSCKVILLYSCKVILICLYSVVSIWFNVCVYTFGLCSCASVCHFTVFALVVSEPVQTRGPVHNA